MEAFVAGDSEKGETLLSRVQADSPVIHVACQCVRSLAATNRGDRAEKVATGRALVALRKPFLVWHCFRVLKPAFQKGQLPAGVRRQLSDPELVVVSFTDLFAVDDSHWRLTWLGKWTKDLTTAIGQYTGSPERLVDLLARLRGHDSGFGTYDIRGVVFACTVWGLGHRDEWLPVFLAYRAVVYARQAAGMPIWIGPARSILMDMAADCWQLVEHYSGHADRHGALIESLANVGDRHSLCEGRKPLPKRRVRGLLREESDWSTFEEVCSQVGSRGRRVGFSPPGSTRRTEQGEAFDGVDADDPMGFPGVLEDLGVGGLAELMAALGRIVGMPEDDHGRVGGRSGEAGSEPDGGPRGSPDASGNKPMPRPSRRSRGKTSDRGEADAGPEQLNLPGFDL